MEAAGVNTVVANKAIMPVSPSVGEPMAATGATPSAVLQNPKIDPAPDTVELPLTAAEKAEATRLLTATLQSLNTEAGRAIRKVGVGVGALAGGALGTVGAAVAAVFGGGVPALITFAAFTVAGAAAGVSFSKVFKKDFDRLVDHALEGRDIEGVVKEIIRNGTPGEIREMIQKLKNNELPEALKGLF